MTERFDDSRRWRTFQEVSERTKEELSRKYRLLVSTMSWFKAVEHFRELERADMILKEPAKGTLEYHRSAVATLIGEGAHMQVEVMQMGGLPEGPAVKTEELRAAVQELRYTQAEWHGTMAADRKQQLLETFSDGPGLEAILDAKLALECCAPLEKCAKLERLEALLEAHRQQAGLLDFGHIELLEALHERSREHQRQRIAAKGGTNG